MRRFLWIVLAGCLVTSQAKAKETWSLVYSKPGQDNAVYALWAVDGSHAWALGVDSSGGSSRPFGVRTSNGASWADMILPAGGGGQFDLTMFLMVAFADENHGWLYGSHVSMSGADPLLYETTDGGGSWTEVTAPSKGFEDLQALPSGQVYGVGESMVFIGDAGSYQEVTAPVPSGMHLASIFMLNSQCGAALAVSDEDSGQETGALLWTSDGGGSWAVRNQDLGFLPHRVFFVDGQKGWLAGEVGGAGLLAWTEDGGQTWTQVMAPDHPAVMGNETAPVTSCVGVRFFDDQRGVGLCLSCTANCDDQSEGSPSYLTVFLRSNDAGRTWTMDPDYEPQMTAPPFGDMVKYSGLVVLAFPDPNHGFLAGQNALILRYEAAQPESDGWSEFSCDSSNSNTNSNGNDNSNNSSNTNNGSGMDDGGTELQGCGCRSQGPAGPLGLFAVLFGLALMLHRRRV